LTLKGTAIFTHTVSIPSPSLRCARLLLTSCLTFSGRDLLIPLPTFTVVGEGLFFPSPTFSCGRGSFLLPLPHFFVGEGRVRVLMRFIHHRSALFSAPRLSAIPRLPVLFCIALAIAIANPGPARALRLH